MSSVNSRSTHSSLVVSLNDLNNEDHLYPLMKDQLCPQDLSRSIVMSIHCFANPEVSFCLA